MEIKILVDFGQDYSVCLTARDARKLYDELASMFEPSKSLVDPGYFRPNIITDPLMGPRDWAIGTSGYISPDKVEDQASPTEATGTLRDTPCNQYAHPNGICNDSSVPLENW